MRALHREHLDPQVEFMHLSSYLRGTVSSGQVAILKDIDSPVAGRDVLILDDILESGRTLAFAKDLLVARGARRVMIAVMLEKPGKRVVQVNADFVGFHVPRPVRGGLRHGCGAFVSPIAVYRGRRRSLNDLRDVSSVPCNGRCAVSRIRPSLNHLAWITASGTVMCATARHKAPARATEATVARVDLRRVVLCDRMTETKVCGSLR